MSDTEKFELEPSNGKRCAQVWVLDAEDLEYWTKQAMDKGYLIRFDFRIDADYPLGYDHPSIDVYQIFPPELANTIRMSISDLARLYGELDA